MNDDNISYVLSNILLLHVLSIHFRYINIIQGKVNYGNMNGMNSWGVVLGTDLWSLHIPLSGMEILSPQFLEVDMIIANKNFWQRDNFLVSVIYLANCCCTLPCLKCHFPQQLKWYLFTLKYILTVGLCTIYINSKVSPGERVCWESGFSL